MIKTDANMTLSAHTVITDDLMTDMIICKGCLAPMKIPVLI